MKSFHIMSIAHISPDGRTHCLLEHIKKTSEIAAQFSGDFESAGWGRLAASWHDLGKCTHEFQNYLLNDGPKTEHAIIGALHAVKEFGGRGRVLAYLIAGHHTGLPDWDSDDDMGTTLKQRLAKTDQLERLPITHSTTLSAKHGWL